MIRKNKIFSFLLFGIMLTFSAPFLTTISCSNQQDEQVDIKVVLKEDAKQKLKDLKAKSNKTADQEFISWLNDSANKKQVKTLFNFSSKNTNFNSDKLELNFVASLLEDKDNKKINFTISAIGNFKLDKTDFSIPLLKIGSYVVGLEFIGHWESTSDQKNNQSIYLKLIYDDGLHTLGSNNNWLISTDSSNPKDGLGIMPVPNLDSIEKKEMIAGIYKIENSTSMTTVNIDINQIFKSDWDILTKNMLYAETNPNKSMPVLAKKAENSTNFTKFFITKYRTYFYNIKK